MIGLSRALDLILTGRSLTAREAFEWGLANKIVACGTGLGQAVQMAICVGKFGKECLWSDRDSTYNAAFSQVFNELLEYEKKNATNVNVTSIIDGAKKFLAGIGKHGTTYNLIEKKTYNWEKEYDNIVTKSKL